MISNKSQRKGRDSEGTPKGGGGRGGEVKVEVVVGSGAGVDSVQIRSSSGGGDLEGVGIAPVRVRRIPQHRSCGGGV